MNQLTEELDVAYIKLIWLKFNQGMFIKKIENFVKQKLPLDILFFITNMQKFQSVYSHNIINSEVPWNTTYRPF